MWFFNTSSNVFAAREMIYSEPNCFLSQAVNVFDFYCKIQLLCLMGFQYFYNQLKVENCSFGTRYWQTALVLPKNLPVKH